MHALRGGTVAGTHRCTSSAKTRKSPLRTAPRHVAFSRRALWLRRKLVEREPGFYGFDELMF